MTRKNATASEFYCTKCGKKGIPIWRKSGREREAGHLKKIWCLHCNKQTNHVECKPFTKYSYEDFLLEFECNNFTEDGQRKMKYGDLKCAINEGKIIPSKEVIENGTE